MGPKGHHLPVVTLCSLDLKMMMQHSSAKETNDALMKQVHSFLWNFSIFNFIPLPPAAASC